ncbi:MAG: penicillin-binding protein 2 [Anaerolineae bacterium]|nr:penicillin-binding protein 2 [Anaerolineae bacterium]
MKTTLNRRLSMLTVTLVIIGTLLLTRLASFQFQLDTAAYLQNIANNTYRQLRDLTPERGRIYDRNGELLAGNMMEYEIGASPLLITDKPKAARELAAALNDDETRIFNLIKDDDVKYVILAKPVSAEVAQKIAKVNQLGVQTAPIPKRIYPQGSLAAQIIGFVGGAGDSRRGYVGVEGGYNSDLAGQVRVQPISPIPFEVNTNDQPPPGRDIVLTIDRSIQYLAETELQDAITKYGATGGSIIIMDPRTGEILAMASYPTFDPNAYFKEDAEAMRNPAVSDVYEPGSVFKIVTASVGLQSGKLTPDWTYYDRSPLIIGGRAIYNWDRAGHGSQNFVDVLVHSWNIGTSNMALTMGPSIFYKGLEDFGVGQRTGIDLEGEANGIFRKPGDLYWSDADIATNSFGQGVAVTPLQMLSFANAIANKGQMMQPHIRLKTIDGNRVYVAQPSAGRTPISPEVARIMTDIMVQVVQRGEGKSGSVKGYTIAGKTGTAQIACPTCKEGYDPDLQEASFVGFLPADEPRVSILIKLDKVGRFASETAAPAFAKLVKRLVVIMNIPTDDQRRALREQGGNTGLIAAR